MILKKLSILFKTIASINEPLGFILNYLNFSSVKVSTRGGQKAMLRQNGIDYWIFIENLILDTYNLDKIKSRHFGTIIDIGSNIGMFTIKASTVWPLSNIICVEPNPESILLLKKNTKLNKIKVKIINKAVVGSKKNKTIKLYFNENPAMASVKIGIDKYVTVKTTLLSRVVSKAKKPLLLKMDIEGGEYSLLNNRNKKIFQQFDCILMETHDINNSLNSRHVKKYLNKIGFVVSVEDRNITAINTY